MVRYGTFIRLGGCMVEMITRYNMFNATMINGEAAAGLVADRPLKPLKM